MGISDALRRHLFPNMGLPEDESEDIRKRAMLMGSSRLFGGIGDPNAGFSSVLATLAQMMSGYRDASDQRLDYNNQVARQQADDARKDRGLDYEGRRVAVSEGDLGLRREDFSAGQAAASAKAEQLRRGLEAQVGAVGVALEDPNLSPEMRRVWEARAQAAAAEGDLDELGKIHDSITGQIKPPTKWEQDDAAYKRNRDKTSDARAERSLGISQGQLSVAQQREARQAEQDAYDRANPSGGSEPKPPVTVTQALAYEDEIYSDILSSRFPDDGIGTGPKPTAEDRAQARREAEALAAERITRWETRLKPARPEPVNPGAPGVRDAEHARLLEKARAEAVRRGKDPAALEGLTPDELRLLLAGSG